MDSGVISWTLSLTALTTGLLGSLHCLGMCGGVSGTVALASSPAESSRRTVPVAVVTVTAAPAAFSA
ncbi:MAG: sulfite exporter TauE/SafE family protein, partial [Burkholderiales bacterium]|nr:sulfite exporter TauE/SafE family protein [Burkholderiales bacterium]